MLRRYQIFQKTLQSQIARQSFASQEKKTSTLDSTKKDLKGQEQKDLNIDQSGGKQDLNKAMWGAGSSGGIDNDF